MEISEKIGFIGQGWIGKNYANDFEARGYQVVRYSLEPEYVDNKDFLAACSIIFIAVPTPTIGSRFDISYVRSALANVPVGALAVIKSTLMPGTTEMLQSEFPQIHVFHSPEFLVEKTAAYDAANPTRNIVGLPIVDDVHRAMARRILDVLPKAPFELICPVKEAELIKYGANCFLYTKVVFANLLYELAQSLGCDYEQVKQMVAADPRIGASHMSVIDDSGRGAGGHCFVKDFEAFVGLYRDNVHEGDGLAMLEAIRDKNVELLVGSNKNLDLVHEVYGGTTTMHKHFPIQNS